MKGQKYHLGSREELNGGCAAFGMVPVFLEHCLHDAVVLARDLNLLVSKAPRNSPKKTQTISFTFMQNVETTHSSKTAGKTSSTLAGTTVDTDERKSEMTATEVKSSFLYISRT